MTTITSELELLRPKLVQWLDTFVHQVPSPRKVPREYTHTFRFLEKSPQQAIVLRLVRILSGLNAIVLLNEHGFCQEHAALQRTLDEFIEDVEFLSQGLLQQELLDIHRQFLEAFYEDPLMEKWDKSRKMKGPNMVKRDKIRAYLADKTRTVFDQNTAINAGAAISHIYSGYVHGAAAHTMDMYTPSSHSFSTNGILASELYADHSDDLWNYLLRTLHAFSLAAKALGDEATWNAAFQEFSRIEQKLSQNSG